MLDGDRRPFLPARFTLVTHLQHALQSPSLKLALPVQLSVSSDALPMQRGERAKAQGAGGGGGSTSAVERAEMEAGQRSAEMEVGQRSGLIRKPACGRRVG